MGKNTSKNKNWT